MPIAAWSGLNHGFQSLNLTSLGRFHYFHPFHQGCKLEEVREVVQGCRSGLVLYARMAFIMPSDSNPFYKLDADLSPKSEVS